MTTKDSGSAALRTLEADCDRAVRGLIQRMLAETSYRPTRFMQMITEHGAGGAVRALLAADLGPGVFHEGLTRLWEEGRLDLSMERLVGYEPRWAQLFTESERALARRRLDELGYQESDR
jgi:hypothetical protein